MSREGLLNAFLLGVFAVLAIGLLLNLVLRAARYRARRDSCYSNLVQIMLASRTYANEHGTGYQTNLICLSNDLMGPVHLVCADDDARRAQIKAKRIPNQGSAGEWRD